MRRFIIIISTLILTTVFLATPAYASVSTPSDNYPWCTAQMRALPNSDQSPFGEVCFSTETNRENYETNLGWHQIGYIVHYHNVYPDTTIFWNLDIMVAFPLYCNSGGPDNTSYAWSSMPDGWNDKLDTVKMYQGAGCGQLDLYQDINYGLPEWAMEWSNCDGHYLTNFDERTSSMLIV